jgi:hypothetical protein
METKGTDEGRGAAQGSAREPKSARDIWEMKNMSKVFAKVRRK